MCTRAELKARAKECLRKYYWMAFLVSLIASILGGGGSGFNFKTTMSSGGSGAVNGGADTGAGIGAGVAEQAQSGVSSAMERMNPQFLFAVLAVFGVLILIVTLAVLVWGVFMGNIIQVGCCRYFMESRETMESAGVGRLFYCFQRGKYMNVVKAMFMRNLFIFLWTLLLIVPGVIKYYEYYMVPYILSENPEMDYRDALKLSKQMMDGQKIELFILQWSFIGWELLGLLACGIGILFVVPYENATFAELYAVLRQESGEAGRSLPGFGTGPQELYTDYTMVE